VAEINNFDTKTFQKLLLENGLKVTWKNILWTHIINKKQFSYILESPEFKNGKLLPKDHIEGL